MDDRPRRRPTPDGRELPRVVRELPRLAVPYRPEVARPCVPVRPAPDANQAGAT